MIESFNVEASTRCIVPYLIQIDSGYGPTPDATSDEATELLVPPSTAGSAGSTMTIEARNIAALEFRRPVAGVDAAPPDRVAVIYPRNDANGEAPLGWTLDDTSFQALDAQIGANKPALEEIAGWFKDTEACV
jgi:hypothetical protein